MGKLRVMDGAFKRERMGECIVLVSGFTIVVVRMKKLRERDSVLK